VSGGEAKYIEPLVLLLALARGGGEGGLDGGPQPGLLVAYHHQHMFGNEKAHTKFQGFVSVLIFYGFRSSIVK